MALFIPKNEIDPLKPVDNPGSPDLLTEPFSNDKDSLSDTTAQETHGKALAQLPEVISKKQKLDIPFKETTVTIPRPLEQSIVAHNKIPTTKKPPTTIEPVKPDSFSHKLKTQFLETGQLYLHLLKNPKLLGKGIIEVLRDFGYELPKSLLSHKKYKDKQEELNVRASQALAISEIVSTAASFAGVATVEALGTSNSVAASAGLIAANYLSAITSYVGSYIALIHGRKDYSKKEAFIDGAKVIKDCIPASIVLYTTEAPIMNVLAQLGLSNTAAAAITLALGLAFFTGIAKAASKETLKERQ